MLLKRLVTAVLTAVLWTALILVAPPADAAKLLFANNASTTIATGISSTGTSVTVSASTGHLFPTITGGTGQHWRGTFVKSGNPNLFEIVLVTATSGDTFTITRAQESTTALAWSVGDFFNLFLTAADTAEFAQFDDLQAQTGNYAVDSGSANAYSVTLSPALAGHNLGMPIRVKFANTNTGTSTFNDGAGALALVTPDLGTLQPGNIQGGGIGVVIYDGTRFELLGTYKSTFAQIGGQVGTAQVPLSAVVQYGPQLFSSPVFTGVPTASTAALGNSTAQLATTAFVNPGSLTTGSGPFWERRASGVLEEWGSAARTTGTGAQSIGFITGFSAVQSVEFSVSSATATGWDTWIQGTPTTSGFQINDDAPGAHAITIYWRAIGR